MELETLFQLMDRFSRSDLSALEWRQGEDAVVLKREMTAAPAAVPAVQASVPSSNAAPAEDDAELVTAPMVGTYYAAPGPEQPPFVKAGDRVKKGETLCLIEAMKMMSEVAAPCDCEILQILKSNGDLAAYGETLFRYRAC